MVIDGCTREVPDRIRGAKERYLSTYGVTVVTGMSGTVEEILAKIEREKMMISLYSGSENIGEFQI